MIYVQISSLFMLYCMWFYYYWVCVCGMYVFVFIMYSISSGCQIYVYFFIFKTILAFSCYKLMHLHCRRYTSPKVKTVNISKYIILELYLFFEGFLLFGHHPHNFTLWIDVFKIFISIKICVSGFQNISYLKET